MAEEEKPNTENNAMTSSEDQLRDLAMQLKQHIEYKEWDDLERLLTVPAVWLFDRSINVPEAISEIRAALDPAADIQLTLDRVTRTAFAEDTARVSLVVHVLWSEQETWAEHQATVEMHLGFGREGDGWRFSSVGFTPAASVAATESAGTPAPYFDTAETARYFGGFDLSGFAPPDAYLTQQLLAHPYFSSLASYLTPTSEFRDAAAAPAPATPPAASPSHVLVYMPVYVPTELIEQHTRK